MTKIIRFIKIFSIIICALTFNTGCANSLPDGVQLVPLNIQILEDKNNNIRFEDIIPEKYSFSQSLPDNYNIGFSYSTWWIRLSLKEKNISDGEYVLLYNSARTKTLDAYINSPKGYSIYRAGNEHGFAARPIPDRIFAFPVTVKNGNVDIFLKIKNNYRIALDLKIINQKTYLKKRSFFDPFYGILLVFFLYNLILFIFIRGTEYLYYSGFLATCLFFLIAFDGTGFMFLWQNSPSWDDFALTGMLILQSFWMIFFFIKFTNSADLLPRATKFLRFLAIMTIPAASLKILFPEHNIILWTLPFLQLIVFTLISISLYMVIRGSKSAIYFFSSLIILLCFSITTPLSSYGIINNSYIVHLGMHIGASINAIILSLGMAERNNNIKTVREVSEKNVKDQNLNLEKKNEELEEKNYKLQTAMAELEATHEKTQSIMEELRISNRLLWDNKQRLSGIVSNAPIGISITDIEGHLLQINDYALRMIGYTREEIIGRSFEDFTHPDDLAKGKKLYSMLTAGEINSYRLDKRFIRKDNTEWCADVSASPIKSDKGEITEIIGLALDINEKIKAQAEYEKIEKQLWQAQKLDAVGTLAGGIAHDFNNILTAIIGYTELAISEIKHGVLNENNLQQILNASKRARDLIKQILTFNRQGNNLKVPQRIVPVIEETIKLIRATTPTMVDIKFIDNTERDIAICDTTQIQQVLLNLCTNANHAMMENGGILTISISNLEIKDEDASVHRVKGGDFILITVSDTGTGMHREILERIFDPFFTTKDDEIGSGLGLSVARGIMLDHGGFINAESEEDKGSRFSLYIPLSTEPESLNEAKDQTESLTGGNERLLIVDDELIIAEITKLIIQKLGYSVKTVADSLEALNIFQSSPGEFDLVITDQTMPRMSGISLAKEIKKIRPDIPVILCTGYSETTDSEKAKEQGITEFLYKPVLAEDLAMAIRRALNLKK